MKFADFHAGQVIEAGPHVLTEAELVRFAKDYDPQWFHTDAEAAAQSPFGGLIASGWHTCAIAMRLVVGAALEGSESFASPGLEHVRWPNPVRPGDALRLVADVIEVRRSEKRPTLGILRWRWRLLNQRGLVVLDAEVTSLFKLNTPPEAAHFV
jgi:acyl dehydratase